MLKCEVLRYTRTHTRSLQSREVAPSVVPRPVPLHRPHTAPQKSCAPFLFFTGSSSLSVGHSPTLSSIPVKAPEVESVTGYTPSSSCPGSLRTPASPPHPPHSPKHIVYTVLSLPTAHLLKTHQHPLFKGLHSTVCSCRYTTFQKLLTNY